MPISDDQGYEEREILLQAVVVLILLRESFRACHCLTITTCE